ncbi:hypothetical protein RUM43_009082 [Polyplax serrata]|uniref:UBA domain-containing protein n=1 Tax=Polyplax serrata TaxID=468196 RepID=A0AAN8NNV0_POLSC
MWGTKNPILILFQDLNTWNCNNSCLQALALSPRTDNFDGKDGRSPLISPKASPQPIRKGITAVTNPPPPLPPRRASPVLGSPTNLPSSNQPIGEASIAPCICNNNSQKTNSYSSASGVLDSAYDVLQTSTGNTSSLTTPTLAVPGTNSSPSWTPPSSESSTEGYPPKTEDSLQYAQLVHHPKNPNYENIIITENNSPGRPTLTIDVEISRLESKVNGNHLSPYKTGFSSSLSPLPPHSPLSSSAVSSSSSTTSGLSRSSSNLPLGLLSPNPHRHTHPLPSPSRTPSNDVNMSFRKSSLDEEKIGLRRKQEMDFNKGDNVSYENLNMDYIAQLTGEGYAHDAVIRALGITGNDVKMACDILHEFATKKTTRMT